MTTNDKQEIIDIDGTVTDISDLLEFVSQENDGWGMPPIERYHERGPNQDGVTDKGFHLMPRVLNLKLASLPETWEEYWELRDILLRLFKPTTEAKIIRRTINETTVRQFEFHLQEGGRFPSGPAQIGKGTEDVFQLVGPNPILYDPTALASTYGVGAGAAGWVFPLDFPGEFGSSTVDQTRDIEYTGSWREYPVITITGPITDLVITNLTTGHKLDLTGYTIDAGEQVVIDTRFEAKTIVHSVDGNIIDKLTNDSNLGQFSLEAHPEAVDGINVIRVTGSAANANTEVYLAYYLRYIGM